MPRLNRRSFLAASAAFVAAPALGAVPASGEVDVVIIGAGAAGIAAARRVAAAKQRFALIEAGNRIGGRCATDGKVFGVPYDLGAHWIHNPDSNPLAKLATGLELYPAPRAPGMRVGARRARDSELESFLPALVRAQRALADAGRAKTDVAALKALPHDLGDWQGAVEFVLGPYGCGKDLKDVSAMDLGRLAERDSGSFCRQGYGGLLAKLAADLPVRLATPAQRIEWDRNGVDVVTPKGMVRGRTAILTVSTNVLAGDKIEFKPELSKRQLDAAAKLALGSYDHIALDMPSNPLGLQRDELVFEQATAPRTAALLANVSGSGLHLIDVAGDFGRELAAKGEAAMLDFAREWLVSTFGTDVKRAIKRSHVTRWNDDPLALGAMSAATPGNSDARKILMEPIGGRLWFAGEAVNETQWGTVNGAWDSGVRAAEAALRRMGALKDPDEDRPSRSRSRRRDDDG